MSRNREVDESQLNLNVEWANPDELENISQHFRKLPIKVKQKSFKSFHESTIFSPFGIVLFPFHHLAEVLH